MDGRAVGLPEEQEQRVARLGWQSERSADVHSTQLPERALQNGDVSAEPMLGRNNGVFCVLCGHAKQVGAS